MATEFPLAGSFSTYSTRFVDEAFGFSIGWNYAFNDAISVAGDLTAAQLLIAYWHDRYTWLASLFFLLFLVLVNFIHVKAYGELEYWLSLLKVILIVIFFFLGIAVNAGGNSMHEYRSGQLTSPLDSQQLQSIDPFPFAGAGSFVNTVILTSILSGGNHALYAGTRVLYGLSVAKQAPAVFQRTTTNGVPWVSLLAIASVSLVFFGASFLPNGGSQIYTWAQNLVGVRCSSLNVRGNFTNRSYRAWKAQGRPISDLKYPNPAGDWGAPIVIFSTSVIILVQGWSAFEHKFDAVSFVANYIELPIFLLLYVVWRVVKRVKTPSLAQIDLDSGRYYDGAEDEEDNAKIEQRRRGKCGWLWKIYGAVA
ncbi:hypothetical protein P7C70_g96, partial [Phenoliferia sp. Uapishka_3]